MDFFLDTNQPSTRTEHDPFADLNRIMQEDYLPQRLGINTNSENAQSTEKDQSSKEEEKSKIGKFRQLSLVFIFPS